MKQLTTFWQFSRPHTIIGSACSITALYLLALGGRAFALYAGTYSLTMLAALACNVFIVGLNQLVDVELDKINKPYLPLAAGTMSRSTARIIIYSSLFIALAAAYMASFFLLLIICVIIGIGIAYSVPPIQLKKHHLPAAICITLVRGLIVNAGMFLHFNMVVNNRHDLPGYIIVLTLFIAAFSIAIAWFKDLPDTEGDAAFQFKTFPLLYDKKTALLAGAAFVALAYMGIIGWAFVTGNHFLLYAHLLLLLLFVSNLFTVTLSSRSSVKRFYLRFWLFFFAAYIVFGLWAVLY
jgi:homogentisate phytyltransferase / homogentisate geranylgeranyltransferase